MVHGRVALTSRTGGRERIAEIVGAGRSFGEAIMFLDKRYIVGARALGDALVLHVAKETIFAELERSPVFARRMIGGLSAKLHATVRELDLYALGSGGQRFAAWLLRAVPTDEPRQRHAACGEKSSGFPAQSQPEHLSRILRQLSASGLIRWTDARSKSRTLRGCATGARRILSTCQGFGSENERPCAGAF